MESLIYKKALLLLDKIYNDKKLSKSQKKKLYTDYLSLIRKAAYSGNSDAQFELGQFYEDINFLGVNKFHNPKKCFYWYSRACEKGHAEACNNLAYCYDIGIGVKVNFRLAKKYYSKAAKFGSLLAKKNLAISKKNH